MTQIRFIVTVISLTIFSVFSKAQCPETNPDFFRTKNWYFGEGIGLTFNSDTILVDTSFVGFNYEGTAILNDLEGKLKYYCDGRFLYDKNHQIVNSSEWLRADNSSCQGIILSESPNNSKLVNILTTTPTYSTQRSGYRYTLYDESLDSFIFINKILIKDVGEKQNSTNHLNNMATWITTHSLLGNLFYSFLLKDEELICCPRITKIGESYTDRFPSQGVLKFSSSGVKVFNANWTLLNFELLSFDKENGILFDSIKVPLFAPSVGEFSHDEKVLFVIDRGQSLFLYRVQDIENMIMDPFDTLVTYKPLEFKISQPQLASDGSIYIAKYQDTILSEIKSVADTFVFIESGVQLNGNKSLGGLPNFNSSYFYTPSIDFAYSEDCWEHTYSFEGRDTFDADGYKWIFEKVNSSELSVVSGKNCVFTFPDTGTWEVSHIAWNTTRADTVTKTLTIRPKWEQDVLGKDTFYCKGDSKGIVLTAPSDMHCVHWNGEEPNLDSALGKIIDYDHFHSDTLLVDTAGTYIVKLTNKTFCQAWDTITISEYPTPSKSGISRFKDSIVSNTVAQTYRWYRDGVPQLETDDRRLKPDSNGTWQVQLVSEYGCDSELSDSLLVGFASIPSIKATNPLSFKVYPNPSDGNITIAVPKGGDYQVLIYDMTGKLIYNTSQSLSVLFELELELVSGTYLLTLTDEDGNVGTKQVVVK